MSTRTERRDGPNTASICQMPFVSPFVARSNSYTRFFASNVNVPVTDVPPWPTGFAWIAMLPPLTAVPALSRSWNLPAILPPPLNVPHTAGVPVATAVQSGFWKPENARATTVTLSVAVAAPSLTARSNVYEPAWDGVKVGVAVPPPLSD